MASDRMAQRLNARLVAPRYGISWLTQLTCARAARARKTSAPSERLRRLNCGNGLDVTQVDHAHQPLQPLGAHIRANIGERARPHVAPAKIAQFDHETALDRQAGLAAKLGVVDEADGTVLLV